MAGLRTNALVATGSALFVLLAVNTPGEVSPTRIAAQVVSGIGFLGAGQGAHLAAGGHDGLGRESRNERLRKKSSDMPAV
jgi:hypothetical protein